MRKTKQNRGITLIALVVTIVVLLILAGVTINAVFNENGLIEKAKDAQNKMNEAQQDDLNAISDLDDLIAEVTGNDSVEEKEETATAWTGAIATAYSGGNGTQQDPYVITSTGELAFLAKEVNEGKDYSGIYFHLGKELNLSEAVWVPIGNGKSRIFKGVFDGNGYRINQMSISGDYNYRGLFGHTGEGSKIMNLQITSSTIEGAAYVGAITGYSKSTKIENVIVDYTELKATKYLGGIAGRSELSTFESITIQDLKFKDANFVGGIVGYADSTDFATCALNGNNVATNCKNYGDYASGVNK